MTEAAIGHIVVYGLLRRGQTGFDKLGLDAAARFVGEVRIPGRMYELDGYPGMVAGEGEVVAELFAIVDPAVMARLDEYELCRPDDPGPYDPATERGSLYRRVAVEAGGVMAWLYLYNGPASDLTKPIPSGDWVRR